MDPYLEEHWGDVHHSLITYARDQLRLLLPKDLRGRVEERVFVESPPATRRPLVPDLRVFERKRKSSPKQSTATASSLALAQPLVMTLDDPVTQGYLEIREGGSGGRLVTVIEVLSPSNKVPGEGQTKYLQKQRELIDGQVSLVEIDLVRAGHRLLPFPVERLPEEYRTLYQVCVRRGWKLAEVEVYRVPLRERLPAIRIPLRKTDADVVLDLQALIELCYRNGDYEDDLDYQPDPDPPLGEKDVRWADALLRRAGHRTRSRSPSSTRRANGRRKP